MQLLVEEILQLQRAWTSENTPEMVRRGYLVRHESAAWLERQVELVSRHLRQDLDLIVEGRDGTGLKTEIPWVRVASESRAPSATIGFYAVYLFSGSGRYVYLSLNQGTTRWMNGEFVPRPRQELLDRVKWARAKLADELALEKGFEYDIDLEATRSLGRGYETGNIAALRYHRGCVPPEDVLRSDLERVVRVLDKLYEIVDRDLNVPGDPPVEITDMAALIERYVLPGRNGASAQLPIHLSSAERLAVEKRALVVARDVLRAEGFEKIRDVGRFEPYALEALSDDAKVYVHVKGTASLGGQFLLTPQEIEANNARYPATVLILVTNIQLDGSANPPTATGGRPTLYRKWTTRESNSTPLVYAAEAPWDPGKPV